MPYIENDRRKKWDKSIDEIVDYLKMMDMERREGELNYVVTSILHKLYKPRYFEYNRAIGVLECIKLELYRKIVSPYEDTKEFENGKV